MNIIGDILENAFKMYPKSLLCWQGLQETGNTMNLPQKKANQVKRNTLGGQPTAGTCIRFGKLSRFRRTHWTGSFGNKHVWPSNKAPEASYPTRHGAIYVSNQRHADSSQQTELCSATTGCNDPHAIALLVKCSVRARKDVSGVLTA